MFDCDIITQDDIDYLVDFINDISGQEWFHSFTILQWFGKHEPKVYEITDLQLEYEDGVVYGGYIEKDLPHNYDCVINGFPTNDIIFVQYHKEIKAVTITLGNDNYDGYIKIFY